MIDTQILCFFSLGMATLSLWIRKTAWLWASFLAISLALALQSGLAKPFALVPIGILFLTYFLLKRDIGGLQRLILTILALAVSAGLVFNFFPWFCTYLIGDRLALTYGKPFIGFFVLVFLLPLIKTKSEALQVGLRAIPLTVLGIAAMAFLATSAGEVAFSPKWPSYFLPRLLINLVFVSIPEEAFFRGFIQEELSKRFGKGFVPSFCAILLTSIVFALVHIGWTDSPAMIGFVFLASLLYGGVYQYTHAIEGSIFCHFTLNLTHMVFFTYHAM